MHRRGEAEAASEASLEQEGGSSLGEVNTWSRALAVDAALSLGSEATLHVEADVQAGNVERRGHPPEPRVRRLLRRPAVRLHELDLARWDRARHCRPDVCALLDLVVVHASWVGAHMRGADRRAIARRVRRARAEPPVGACLLYTSPSPRDGLLSRMPSSA